MAMTTVTGSRDGSRHEQRDDSERRRAGAPDWRWSEGGDVQVRVRSAVVLHDAVRRGPVSCPDAHAPDLYGSRLTPRGRLAVGVVWLLMGALAVLMMVTIPHGGERPPATTTIMVEPGETLWQLASYVQPGADRHETVAAIMSLNGLESASEIRPGDVLVVPVQP